MSRQEIITLVKDSTRMVVQSGPFSGLRLHDMQTWDGGEDVGPQLLGVCEQELHPILRRGLLRRWWRSCFPTPVFSRSTSIHASKRLVGRMHCLMVFRSVWKSMGPAPPIFAR